MVYLIKSFWDLMEKKNTASDNGEEIQIKIEDDEYEGDNQPDLRQPNETSNPESKQS